MRRINPSKQVHKFLRPVPPKHGRQLAAKIRQLADDPHPPDSKPLKGYPYRRADSGEYRIIYEYDDAELRVVAVGKRNDDEVYRQLGRRS
jgi:mRNA interferase RelE/StbE